MESIDDPIAVEYVYILQDAVPDESGNVLQDLPVGAHLRGIYFVNNGGMHLSTLYEMVVIPGCGNLILPPNSKVIFREQIIPDWRRIELRAGLDDTIGSPTLQRWNTEVIGQVLLEVARACVELGYHPPHHRRALDLVAELGPGRRLDTITVTDPYIKLKRTRLARVAPFQMEHGKEMNDAMQKICTSYGLPTQFIRWMAEVFLSGPGSELARHILALMGQVSGGPLLSVAMRLSPETWGINTYQPGSWLSSVAADYLLPKPYDFVIRGNIRLWGTAGFVEVWPWLTNLKLNSALGPGRLRRKQASVIWNGDHDGRWAIRLSGGLLGEPPDWPAGEVNKLLSTNGDFLIGANLETFGSRQLRRIGGVIRQKSETHGSGVPGLHPGRPRLSPSATTDILQQLAMMAQGILKPNVLKPVEGNRLIDKFVAPLRGYLDRDELEVHRTLARWRWQP